MKCACICGWVGRSDQRAVVDGAAICPDCARETFHVIPCHWCHTAAGVQLIGERMYRCDRCGRHFDDEPEEGAASCYTDPVTGAMKKEEWENRRRARRLPR